MSGIEYHQEAQRKQRVFDKKREAIERMRTIEKEQSEMIRRAQSSMYRDHQRKMDEYEGVLRGSRHGYNTRSKSKNTKPLASDHDSGYTYRQSKGKNVHPDPIYKIMYPGFSATTAQPVKPEYVKPSKKSTYEKQRMYMTKHQQRSQSAYTGRAYMY